MKADYGIIANIVTYLRSFEYFRNLFENKWELIWLFKTNTRIFVL